MSEQRHRAKEGEKDSLPVDLDQVPQEFVSFFWWVYGQGREYYRDSYFVCTFHKVYFQRTGGGPEGSKPLSGANPGPLPYQFVILWFGSALGFTVGLFCLRWSRYSEGNSSLPQLQVQAL